MRRVALIATMVIAATAFLLVTTGAANRKHKAYEVRAIFDNAAFAVPGEDVRIAGANVGSIQSLSVCTKAQDCAKSPYTPLNHAAVTISINNSQFTPFYSNATCTIRPQSLIAERYVDCEPGSSSATPLTKITSGPGSGTYYLPVTQTTSPIDTDIVQNISQQPIRERFALILNELGTGLAARGTDLNAVIHRANPALGYTDQVLKILARENRVLANLATDSDQVLAPLARAKNELKDFVVQANTTAVASAAEAPSIQASFRLFPSFLRQLQPLMVDLGQLADQGTPLMASLAQAASAINRQFANLKPFATASTPALISLGNSSQTSQPHLLASTPLANQLLRLGNTSEPTATSLERLTSSLNKTGALENLMGLLFNGTSAANSFDSAGHYVRVQPLVGDCTGYALTPVNGCSANFSGASKASAAKVSAAVAVATQAVHKARATRRPDALSGLLRYLIGSQ